MTKTGAEKVQATAIGHNSGELRKAVDSIIDKKRKMQTLSASIAKDYVDADDKGFDRKALKQIVAEEMKPIPTEYKRDVNNMRRALNQSDLFSLPDPKIEEEKAKKEIAEKSKGKAA